MKYTQASIQAGLVEACIQSCDARRVLVLHQGRISGELPIAECTQARLGLLMTVGAPA